jgi:hypothetical protein
MDLAHRMGVSSLDRISLDQLLSVPIPLTAEDAVAVITQLARSPQTGRPTGARLAAEHVWLEPDGAVRLAPGLLPSRAEVGALLQQLLSVIQRAQPDGVPRGLELVAQRAAGQLESARMPSLTALAAALQPFQPVDPAGAIRALVAAAGDPRRQPEPVPVTPPPPVAPSVVTPVALSGVRSQRVTPALVRRPLVTTHVAPQDVQPQVMRPQVVQPPVATPPVVELPLNAPPGIPARLDQPRVGPKGHWGGVAVATLAASVLAALIGARIARDLGPPALPQAAASDVSPIAAASNVSSDEQAAASKVSHDEKAAASKVSPDEAGGTPTVDPTGPLALSMRAPSMDEPAAPPTRMPPSDRRPTAPAPATAPTLAPLIDGDAVRADAVFSPSFASHGSAVFFHAQTAEGSALKRADAGERGELRIATIVDDGARNHHVQLSPAGTRLAFDSDRDGVRGVYVASADGRDVRRVSGPGYAAVPTWSPDGRRLAFIRGEPARPRVWNLWLLDLASGRQTRVTAFRRGQVWGGAWFADGRRLAFSHEDGLTIHDLDSGESRRFASPLPGRLVRTPAVSPDGRWIVFQVFRDGVWLLDLDRHFMQRVLQDPSAEEFTWSPDGRRVAFHSRRSGGWSLWTMTAP